LLRGKSVLLPQFPPRVGSDSAFSLAAFYHPHTSYKKMNTHTVMALLMICMLAHAELPYKLPPKAKYDVSAATIAVAKTELSTHLAGDAATLTNLFVSPTMCGPGLWHILKKSSIGVHSG
jgi:hypothetical protein